MDNNQCVSTVCVKNEEGIIGEKTLICENIIEIAIENEESGQREAGTITCTPCDLKELVCGWLFSEGYIKNSSEMGHMTCSEKGCTLTVHVRITSSGQNPTMAGDESRCATISKKDFIGERNKWDSVIMRQVYQMFREDPPLHAQTRAAHSCMIVRQGKILQTLYRSEDAGRHSAMDKAIGWALLHNVDLSDCLLMTSGRISTRMATKAARAGAGALAGKGTVTTEAVDIADRCGMVLIGLVQEDSALWFKKTSE